MKDNYMYKHRKEKKSLMFKKKNKKKNSVTSLVWHKEKECCKFDKTWTASLSSGLKIWLFDHSDTINQVFKITFLRKS